MDTRDKRASAVAVGLGWLLIAPTPDSDLSGSSDRLHVAGLYRLSLIASDFQPLLKALDRAGARLVETGAVSCPESGFARATEG